MSVIRAQLTEKAAEVAALLNTIVDDDERERTQEHFERVLNDELFHGSEVRAAGLWSFGVELVACPFEVFQ